MRRFTAFGWLLGVVAAAYLPCETASGDLQPASAAGVQVVPAQAWEAAPTLAGPMPEGGFPVPLNGTQPNSVVPANVMGGSSITAEPLLSDTVYRNRAWRADFGVMPSGTLHATGQFADWPDDPMNGIRFNLGYETDHGWGTRFRLSVLGQTWTGPGGGAVLELMTGTGSVDFYKRLFLESTEVVVGMGLGTGEVTVRVNNRQSDFGSGGGTAFTELWHPLLRFRRWDVGFAGRARVTVTMGSWENTLGSGTVDETEGDTMTISEIAWGLEFRRRFGVQQDHYWYMMLLVDTQSFNSPWLTVNTGSAISFSGLNLTVGIAY